VQISCVANPVLEYITGAGTWHSAAGGREFS